MLKEFGFSVTKKTNVPQQEMEEAIRVFGKQLHAGDTALFYFSGHGVQVNGINYLLPIGILVDSEDEIKYKAVAAEMVLDKMEQAGSQLNIVILDACRNNPFQRFRSLSRGLAQMSSPAGTLIAYATAPGSVAYDGDERNSPYTKYLLQTIKTPGLEIEKVFKHVRIAVMAETENKQVPWESSSLTGDFYFTSPSTTMTIDVPGTSQETKTKLIMDRGDQIKFTATGQVTTIQDQRSPKATPNGNGDICAEYSKKWDSNCRCLIPSSAFGALIGKISNAQTWFLIGKQNTITMNQKGELILGINDCVSWADNGGYFTVTIEKLP